MELQNSTMLPRNYGLLVADDEPGVRQILGMGMRHAGFNVWLAPDGEQALYVYGHLREAIDVVLLDVCMPILNGPQALAAMKEVTPDLRCCFMSGYLGDYTVDELQQLGAAKVYSKPLNLAEMAHDLLALARGAESDPPAPVVQMCPSR